MSRTLPILFCISLLAACGHRNSVNADDAVLAAAADRPQEWLTHGLNYSENRYSPLTQVTKENVQTLGLAWVTGLGSKRGLEATPLIADGVMYLTGVWSIVYAIDAFNGNIRCKYDPKVPPGQAERLCRDIVNRGVALYKGKIYSGTLDGRLIALDAATGKLDWEVLTVDTTKLYSITGAPRVVDGKALIGNLCVTRRWHTECQHPVVHGESRTVIKKEQDRAAETRLGMAGNHTAGFFWEVNAR